MQTWTGNHTPNLPCEKQGAWMFHGRDIQVSNKWVATLSIYAPEFGVTLTKTIYGVQDDFGNFVEVPYV